MGLPLFVAPVESDLPPKAANKSRAASPARSAIRRSARPDSRERRATIRRAATLREHHRVAVERLSQPQSSSNTGRRESRPVPWIESGFPPDYSGLMSRTSDGLERPFREVLREMTEIDNRHREQMSSIFGSHWRGEEADRQDADPGLSSFESRPRYARGPTVSTPMDRIEDTPRPRQRTLAYEPLPPNGRGSGTPSTDAAQRSRRAEARRRELESRTIRIPDYTLSAGDNGDRATAVARRGASDRHPRSIAAPVPSLSRRYGTSSRTREINGLGDRDRSLSPEVWDTLLTTLTPDPQPPSAGSSFASTVASQSAGVSSSTSLTGPDGGNAVDPACESGCENSDHEGPDYEHPEFAGIRRRRDRRDESRRVRLRVPEYDVDVPVNGPTETTSNAHEGYANSDGSGLRLQRGPEDQLFRRPSPPAMDGRLSPFLRRQATGWVGQLSIGTSDDERGMEPWSLNRESSAVSGNIMSPGEDEWSGMRRIVRSLARREHVPDEWWAEVGLSRTLPENGTD